MMLKQPVVIICYLGRLLQNLLGGRLLFELENCFVGQQWSSGQSFQTAGPLGKKRTVKRFHPDLPSSPWGPDQLRQLFENAKFMTPQPSTQVHIITSPCTCFPPDHAFGFYNLCNSFPSTHSTSRKFYYMHWQRQQNSHLSWIYSRESKWLELQWTLA